MVEKIENSISKSSEITRGAFCKGLFLSIAAAFTGQYVVKPIQKIAGPMWNLEADNSYEKDDVVKINIMLNFIKRIYGIDVYNGESLINRYLLNNLERMDFNRQVIPDTYDLHKQMSIPEIRTELIILVDEIIKYPPNMFGKGKVSFVRLIPEFNSMYDLLDRDTKYDGFASISFKRGHFQASITAKGMRNIFHHEMFHSFCFQNMSVYNRFFNRGVPALESYTKVYDDDPHDLADIREDYNPNFFEDIANLAGLMMSSKSHKEFLLRIKVEDEEAQKLLQAKYDAIKEIFYDFSDGLMDEQYWKDLLNDEIIVDENDGVLSDKYWTNKTKKHILIMKKQLDEKI